MRAAAVLLCLLFAGCREKAPPAAAGLPESGAPATARATGPALPKAEKPAAAKVYTREEFREALQGKTPEEVLALLGRPEKTSESGASTFWDYPRRTKDAVTGKVDTRATVIFRGGVVDGFSF